MAKEPTAQPTVWGLLGIMAACFFGVLSLYHAVFWLWQVVAYHADKGKAWTHLAMWLVLGAGSGLVWCRLLWLMYFPKKKV
jgi:hypothetical protein